MPITPTYPGFEILQNGKLHKDYLKGGLSDAPLTRSNIDQIIYSQTGQSLGSDEYLTGGEGRYLAEVKTVGGRNSPLYTIPIYRSFPKVAVEQERSKDTDAKPASPIDLSTNSLSNSTSNTYSQSVEPPIQDFKLDDQARSQKKFLDDKLASRMQRFQSLIDSLVL